MIASRSPFLEAVLLHRLAILAVVVLRPVVRSSVARERVANPILDVAPHARREERGLCVHLGQAERDGKDRSGIVRLARGLCFLPRAADIRDEVTEAGWLGLACDDERLTFVQLRVRTRARELRSARGRRGLAAARGRTVRNVISAVSGAVPETASANLPAAREPSASDSAAGSKPS